ncbi:MAG TPA: helix-turn-helix domain-containing protein [Acidimicrobiia bacterium]|jgi:sugar diacid utilization regulator
MGDRGSGTTDRDVRLREQISNLHSLFVLSMMMMASRDEDEILRLALTSVASLGSCRAEGAYLLDDGKLVSRPEPVARHAKLVGRLAKLDGADRAVAVPGSAWGWAYPLRSLEGYRGYLVVGADSEPSADELFLLRILAHQTGTSLANASLHRSEQAHAGALEAVNKELASVNDQLAATVSDLKRSVRIHEALTEVSASGGGEEGIARAVHDLTGRSVAVEDRFGNLRAWAGPDRPDPYPKPDARKRAQVLRQARRDGRPVRDGDRLVALAQPRDEVLGVLALIDPDRTAGLHDVLALEHGAVVLAMELAHLRSLAETELRLHRDLVHDLVSGTDDESAYARAEAIGYDLHRSHHVVVTQGRGRSGGDALARAVEQAAVGLEQGSLLGRRSGAVLLLAHGPPGWDDLLAAVVREVGPAVAMGVGGRCETPADFPRSAREAFLALEIRQASLTPDGVTAYDDLGIYRLLAQGEHNRELEGFVRQWLGSLLDYDAKSGSELVKTLAQYLECGGNYDETAEAIAVHRSTLRYRLQRIREISGLDLNDVDSRFNLHVATRAWRVLGGAG